MKEIGLMALMFFFGTLFGFLVASLIGANGKKEDE